METRKLIGLNAGAKMLGLKVPTLRKWIRSHRLAHFRVGGRIMLDEAEVERFIDAGRVEASEEPKIRPHRGFARKGE